MPEETTQETTQAEAVAPESGAEEAQGQAAPENEQDAQEEAPESAAVEESKDSTPAEEPAVEEEAPESAAVEESEDSTPVEEPAEEQPDADALRAQLATAQAQLRQERVNHAIAAEAAALGFRNPAHAAALMNAEGVSVDEEGNVTGVAEALAALAEEAPYLVAAPTAPNTNAAAQNSQTGGRTPEQRREFAAIYGLNPDYVE